MLLLVGCGAEVSDIVGEGPVGAACGAAPSRATWPMVDAQQKAPTTLLAHAPRAA
jgi:hypothetical protein